MNLRMGEKFRASYALACSGRTRILCLRISALPGLVNLRVHLFDRLEA